MDKEVENDINKICNNNFKIFSVELLEKETNSDGEIKIDIETENRGMKSLSFTFFNKFTNFVCLEWDRNISYISRNKYDQLIETLRTGMKNFISYKYNILQENSEFSKPNLGEHSRCRYRELKNKLQEKESKLLNLYTKDGKIQEGSKQLENEIDELRRRIMLLGSISVT